MDPLTHAVTGVAVAASVPGAAFGARYRRSALLLGVGALAGIAPDVDFFSGFPHGRDPGLAYLLYHRGVTHTVLGCAVISAVLTVAVRLLAGRHLPALRVFGIAFVAALLHVAMDGTNDYGVHPFWPLLNDWFYGDFIFLLEPMVIACVLPISLSAVLQDWGSRRKNVTALVASGAVVLLCLALPWFRLSQGIWVTFLSATVATVWAVSQLVLALKTQQRVYLGWGSLAAVFLLFFSCSRYAKAIAQRTFHEVAAKEELRVVDTTPAAANPLCWRVTWGSETAKGDIVARMAVVSLAPSIMAPEECRTATPKGPPTFGHDGEIPWPPRVSDRPERWHWLAQVRTSREALTNAMREHPRVAAAAHSLRIPVLKRVDDTWMLGDFRLDYERDLASYCKYLLPKEPDTTPFKAPPLWTPPFLTEARAPQSGAKGD